MRITLVGSRHFGVTTFNTLRQHGVDYRSRRLFTMAKTGLPPPRGAPDRGCREADRNASPRAEIRGNTELNRDAHSHARVTREALPPPKLGGIGYHPLALPPASRSRASNGHQGGRSDPGGNRSTTSPTAWMPCHCRAGMGVRQEKGEIRRELWDARWPRSARNCFADVIYHAKAHGQAPRHVGRTRNSPPKAPTFPTLKHYELYPDTSLPEIRRESGQNGKFFVPGGTGFTLMCLIFRELSTVLRRHQVWRHMCDRIKPRHHTHFGGLLIHAFQPHPQHVVYFVLASARLCRSSGLAQ